jgi:hydroxybutyrate-dimer hydrolase
MPNTRPDYIKGTIVSTTYDGNTNDLLTGGLGKTGLGGACPAPATPTAPTVAELRTIAICNNYKAIVDTAANGGYGTLYGPNIDASGNSTLGEGKIAGEEHIAFADDGTGRENVTMMVQIPNSSAWTTRASSRPRPAARAASTARSAAPANGA